MSCRKWCTGKGKAKGCWKLGGPSPAYTLDRIQTMEACWKSEIPTSHASGTAMQGMRRGISVRKRFGLQTWSLYVVSASAFNEDAARFYRNFHCRLTDHPVSLQPVWPLFVEGKYIIRHNQNIEKQANLINLIVYGFLAIIALICGLNIFNTMWADLENRRREIALLRAVGMEITTLQNYLQASCLQYAVWGMMPGIIVGMILLYATIRVLQDYFFISMYNPFTLIMAVSCATILLMLLAGSMPIHRARHASIIEELRDTVL